MPKDKPSDGRVHDRDAFFAFVDEFKNESDRAAVIIGTAKLDYLLYQVLAKFLLPSAGSVDELLEGDSPLSTFSSRINIAYRLGLIDSQFARALHLTRRIRNSFAHEISGCKLDSGAHRDRVKELIAPLVKHDLFADFKFACLQDKQGYSADFFAMLGIMVLALEKLFERAETIRPALPFSLIPPAYESPRKQIPDFAQAQEAPPGAEPADPGPQPNSLQEPT